MPSMEREESRDRELVLKHQPSVSESGRASVPMYVNPADYYNGDCYVAISSR
jgi:flavoprotein